MAEPWIDMAARLRRELRLTGAELAVRLRLARSTVAGHLARRGIGRLSAVEERPPVIRFERERPGELLPLDTKRLARFDRVGHRITGNRRGASDGAGWEVAHVAVDDASRLAYVEVLPDEKRATTTSVLIRALRWLRARGIRVERVRSDNGSGYVSRLFQAACGAARRWSSPAWLPTAPQRVGSADRSAMPHRYRFLKSITAS